MNIERFATIVTGAASGQGTVDRDFTFDLDHLASQRARSAGGGHRHQS